MEKQKISLREKWAYAHWSAKEPFGFPVWIGHYFALILAVVYAGLVFWFFEPELIQLMNYHGEHGLGKSYFARLFAIFALIVVGYATAYVLLFLWALIYRNEADYRYFMKYRYKKRFLL